MTAPIWVVCESGDRWRRALHHIASSAAATDPVKDFCTSSITETRALAHQHSPLIILWEIPATDPREMVEAIDVCGRRANRPLQIVALSPDLDVPHLQSARLLLAIRQIGAGIILRHPEQLSLAMKLATHYLARRTGDVGVEPPADLDNGCISPTV